MQPHDQIDFDARLDLTAAILERDRLRQRYEEVAGSREEIDIYVELHAANVRVNARLRYLEWSEGTPIGQTPVPSSADLEPFLLCEECAIAFEVSHVGTHDRVQWDLGTPPSPRLAAELNREAALGGEPPLCPPEHRAKQRRFARG